MRRGEDGRSRWPHKPEIASPNLVAATKQLTITEMKNILLIFAALVIIASCNPAPDERANFLPYSNILKYYMLEISADTITIDKADNIVGVSVSVPTGATDTTFISGDTITFDGVATTSYPVAPGEYVSIGYDVLERINSLEIIAQDAARVILVPIKE